MLPFVIGLPYTCRLLMTFFFCLLGERRLFKLAGLIIQLTAIPVDRRPFWFRGQIQEIVGVASGHFIQGALVAPPFSPASACTYCLHLFATLTEVFSLLAVFLGSNCWGISFTRGFHGSFSHENLEGCRRANFKKKTCDLGNLDLCGCPFSPLTSTPNYLAHKRGTNKIKISESKESFPKPAFLRPYRSLVRRPWRNA